MTDASPAAPAAPAPPARLRGGLRALIIVLAALGAVLYATATVVAARAVAEPVHEDTLAARTTAVRDTERTRQNLERSLAAHELALADGRRIVDGATADLLDADAVTALTAALDAAADDVPAVAEAADVPLPRRVDEIAFWPWTIAAQVGTLREDIRDAQQSEAALEEAQRDLRDTVDALDETATPLFASAESLAPGLESANVSARTETVIAFRKAAATVAEQDDVSAISADAVVAYVAAADALRTSQAAELAEKEGPLRSARLEAEAFARSLSGGVLLDFDWKPIVNGYGYSDSMAGTATWQSADGGSSTITLTNSIARLWPSVRSKALIAHEVGHSISAKCYEMFDWESRDANEEWATAWAISMGFTDDANGVQAYGYPRQSVIDTARTCR